MKVVDIERVVILMRFIQYEWDEKRKKSFDDNLRMMLETQCEDLEEHDEQIRADAIDECISKIDKLTTYYAGDKEGNAITPKVVIKEDVIKALEQLKEQI